MKQVTAPVFEAFDGSRFLDEAACRAHEDSSFPARFVGLTLDQVNAALDRSDPELADAFEIAGNRIGVKRRESGELRRRGPKAAGAPDPAPEPSPPPTGESFGDRFAAARAQISTNPEDRRDSEDEDGISPEPAEIDQ